MKIVDFGIAQIAEEAGSAESRRAHGTVSYMSPEQVQGDEADLRSDLWSLGVVLFEMIEGRPPFRRGKVGSALRAITNDEPPPLSIAETRPSLSRIILKLLSKRPGDRYDGATALLGALLEESPRHQLEPSLPQSGAKRSMRIGVAAAVILAALAFTSQFVLEPERPTPAVLTPQPLTTELGNEDEPDLSPDGRRVAYSWTRPGARGVSDIYIREIDSQSPVRLTASALDEHTPAWSPDGSRIAYLRCEGESELDHELVTIAADGTDERLLANFFLSIPQDGNHGTDWSPDGTTIAVGGVRGPTSGPTSVALVSASDGSVLQTYEPPPRSRHFGPKFSPDGTKLAFTRRSAGKANETVVIDLPNGEARAFQSRAYGAHEWERDGQGIMISGPAAVHERRLWRLDLTDGRVSALPMLADSARYPSVAGDLLAYARWTYRLSLWSLPLSIPGVDPATAGPARPVIQSTRQQYSPDYSPDGTQVVFVSDRSGVDQIWVATVDGSKLRQLTTVGALPVDNPELSIPSIRPLGSPRWSPDGTRIAFDMHYRGKSTIMTIAPSGGQPVPLTDSKSVDRVPSWSRDGRWVYFSSNRSGRREVWRVAADGEELEQVTFDRGHLAEESFDGRSLYYSKGSNLPGLWRRSLPDGREEGLSEVTKVWPRGWRVVESGLYYLGANPDDGRIELRSFDGATREVRTLAVIDQSIASPLRGIAVSPSRGAALLPIVDEDNKDIMIVKGLR